jgi:hypothetical protein
LRLSAARAQCPGEQFTSPNVERTEKVLPEPVYVEQPTPSMQNVCVSQSTEKELEPKSNAQPVFEVAARTSESVLLFTAQVSVALLQMGQANGAFAPAPASPPPSLDAIPPHAPTKQHPTNPAIHRPTH